jgi:hypothetical protein
LDFLIIATNSDCDLFVMLIECGGVSSPNVQ